LNKEEFFKKTSRKGAEAQRTQREEGRKKKMGFILSFSRFYDKIEL